MYLDIKYVFNIKPTMCAGIMPELGYSGISTSHTFVDVTGKFLQVKILDTKHMIQLNFICKPNNALQDNEE